ncbi:hypothetical protein HC031_04010 [Planosporangium thailandense]|uniref:Uncharacterized protein n=1 Tax=Planosporangium thailandense TaxID=765197 RepID=A0ABX0XSB2_9ACTN|nr:hypothetical protein [Planosporangium thailandense]NJC68894.1 hypothetical protein [Planosporangium thailandense]
MLADSVELAHKRAGTWKRRARLTYQALALGRAAELPDCPPEFLRAIDAGTQCTA